MKMTRRKFLFTASSFFWVVACGPLVTPAPKAKEILSADIALKGEMEEIAATLQTQALNGVEELLNGTRRELRVGLGGERVITLSLSEERGKRIQLHDETTGETKILAWGLEGIRPSIRLLNDRGIVEQEIPFRIPQLSDKVSAKEFLKIGVAIVALALVAWLGVEIAGLLVQGLAFLAFLALAMGALIFAVTLLKPFFAAIGVNVSDIKKFFEGGIDALLKLFREIPPFRMKDTEERTLV